MAHLSDAEKHAIVRLLACDTPPFQVVAAIRKEFGKIIDRFQVRTYDPRSNRCEVGERWRTLFYKERQAYLQSIHDIPISHKGYRLGMLQRLLDQACARGDIKQAMQLLKQAAKEAGGVNTGEIVQSQWSGIHPEHSELRKATVHQMFEQLGGDQRTA